MKRRAGAMVLAAAISGCVSSNHGPEIATEPTVRASGAYMPLMVPGGTGPWGQPVVMPAPYTLSPPVNASQARQMMSESIPLGWMQMDPSVVQAAAQMPGAGPGMPGPMAPPGGMISPPGVPFSPGMMPPGGMMGPGGMMPPGAMMPPAGGPGARGPALSMPGGMMPGLAGAMPNAPPGAGGLGSGGPLPPGSMQFMPGGPFPGGRPPGAVAALGAITGPGYMPQGKGYSIG